MRTKDDFLDTWEPRVGWLGIQILSAKEGGAALGRQVRTREEDAIYFYYPLEGYASRSDHTADPRRAPGKDNISISPDPCSDGQEQLNRWKEQALEKDGEQIQDPDPS